MTKTQTGLAAFGSLAFFCVCGVCATVMLAGGVRQGNWERARPTNLIPADQKPASTGNAATPRKADPWPECAAVRQWFAENVGDPGAVEIVKWEERKPVSWTGKEGVDRDGKATNDPPGSAVIVRARYRGRNQFGGMQVEVRAWSFSGSKLNWTQTIPQ